MIVELWNRVMDLAKAGTSGMDTQDEFNSKLNSAQIIVEEALIDVSEINQKATDALAWLKIRSGVLVSDATGAIALPDDYLHLDSLTYLVPVENASYTAYPASKLETNQIDTIRTSPIRKPNLATNDINYYFAGNSLFVMPEQAGISVKLFYYQRVPDASIVLTPVQDDDGDLVTPGVGTELGWPQSVFMLLTYAVLEQYGIEVREPMIYEYAQFGISREMIKTNPQ